MSLPPTTLPDADPRETVDARTLPRAAANHALRNYLLVFEIESTRMFELPAHGDVMIGRADNADLKIDDASISRIHARISVHHSGLKVADLDSQNGTFVNDEKVTGARPMQSGDVITIGGITLVFHSDLVLGAVLPSSRFRAAATRGSAPR